MNGTLRATLVISWAACFQPAPASWAQERLPDRAPPARPLIGADENGYPRIADEDKAKFAILVAASDTPQKLRFDAIWGLAISGYSPEAATGLIQAAEDRSLSDTARNYAAMGLMNFSNELPLESKGAFRRRLRTLVDSEGASVPDSILRTLIAWGDAEWIAERLGGQTRGHMMEIEILCALETAHATGRLLELYRVDEVENKRETYNRRAEIGRALLGLRDKRGIDILESLLDAEVVPLNGEHPNHQYRSNVFNAIAHAVGKDFGYVHSNYDPSIDEAIRRFRFWWLENRYMFTFPDDDRAPRR